MALGIVEDAVGDHSATLIECINDKQDWYANVFQGRKRSAKEDFYMHIHVLVLYVVANGLCQSRRKLTESLARS